jgi:hypothetical protein
VNSLRREFEGMRKLCRLQTKLQDQGKMADMETPSGPRIVHAERLNGGVIISFDDGVAAVYPAALLYEMLDRADVLKETDED